MGKCTKCKCIGSNSDIPCPRCRGLGIVSVGIGKFDAEGFPKYKDCPKCKGDEITKCLCKCHQKIIRKESDKISSAEVAWCGLAWGGGWCWCQH